MSRSLYGYNDECIYNSGHSYERAKERGGFNRKRAEKLIERARIRGIGYEDCRWSIDKRFLMNRTGENTKAIAYNGFCFIFNTNSFECITMYSLPRYFGKKKTFYYSDKDDGIIEQELKDLIY